ncbi:hypothetical protein V6N13_091075 [Hibiscus sabdariffa]
MKHYNVPLNVSDFYVDCSNKAKERPSDKIKKKVSFNLNVQTYEPIPDVETTTFSFYRVLKKKKMKRNEDKLGKEAFPFSQMAFRFRCRLMFILVTIDTRTV